MNTATVAATSTLVLLVAATQSTPIHAQEYPVRPIRMMVPNPPGGVTDVLVRLVAPRMSEALGQPIVIENLPGAGGVPGTNLAAKATPEWIPKTATETAIASSKSWIAPAPFRAK
jgi:tripartite-type tricarboxylate transporter receptor subunit TctC